MSKALQVLVGAACLVIIVAGCWIGLGRYSAYAEAKRFEAFSSEMKLKRQAAECDQLLRRPDLLDDFAKDMCTYIKKQAREAK